MTTEIHINTAEIPHEVGEAFGRVILSGFKKFLEQPDGRARLEAQMRTHHQERKKDA